VHDVGRLLRPGHGPARPGHGADALRPLLGERVSRLVRLNVSAARYLALVPPDRGPSPRGALALVRQGGPTTPAEAAGLEQDPLAEDAVTLRQTDAAGRVVGFDAGVPEDWRTVLELVAARRAPLPVPDAVRHHHLPGA
jgi:predicted HD phosphohydrolase